MHNILIIPSDSVLWEKTMEASYLVGSSPVSLTLNLCLISLFGMGSGNRQPLDISALSGRLLTAEFTSICHSR